MATNKNATIRYQTLNRCFRNPGRKYYMEDLVDACNDSLLDIDPSSTGIKKRQIFDDIKFMRDSQGSCDADSIHGLRTDYSVRRSTATHYKQQPGTPTTFKTVSIVICVCNIST